ncbi:MAG TPA: SDR family NAD(P)-dependent oxidoreductase [Acidimicrobiales bacterium]|nr:SDR family NAD(P)-dependent oxidoreductase [Acidimicrobiales bacterium]
MIDFDDQVVIVTGAGRGLGRLYSIEFARRGASVVVNDVGSSMQGEGSDPAVADSVVSEIEQAGGRAIASYESVASPTGAEEIVLAAVNSFGRLDAVVSNAGIFHTIPFEELAARDWDRMLTVHLNGGFYLSQQAFRVMKSQGYGRFVFMVSAAGLFGQPNSAHYAAAKSGLVGLANVIAIEGAPFGIMSNCVLPMGYSRMVLETVGDSPHPAVEPFLTAIKPELAVAMVVFLASRACELTHHNFSAAAGRYARVFTSLGQGWLSPPGSVPTADDIASHLSEVSEIEPFTVPTSIFDEVAEICRRREIPI